MIRDIVAVDECGGMAKNGKTPWVIPEDLAYFHVQTMRFGGHLLVGRGTYEAMKQAMTSRSGEQAWPPVGRKLYVLTSHDLSPEPGVTVVRSLEPFLQEMASAGKDVWNGSIGEVEADEIYLTRIAGDYGCDKFYPMDRFKKYTLIKMWPGKPRHGEPRYVFEMYSRIHSAHEKSA